MSAPARDDEYGYLLDKDHQPENRLCVDASGRFELAGPMTDDELPMFRVMAQLRTLYPLDPEAIVWPQGWHADPDTGRGVPDA